MKHLETASALALLCIVLFFITGRVLFVYVSSGLLVTGLFIKPLAMVVHVVWTRVSGIIGNVVSGIVLVLLFYLVLTPLAILRRILGRDALMLKQREETYFVPITKEFSRDDLEKPW